MLKSAFVPVVALSLMANPVLAQSSVPVAAPEPAAESVDGSEMYRGGFIIPLVAIAAIVLLLFLTDTFPFDDEPASP